MVVMWISLLLLSAFPFINCQEKYLPSSTFKHPVARALFEFGYQLYEESLTPDTENIVISPESVYSALALLLPGLKGDSFAEVDQALGGSHLADVIAEHNAMNNDIFNNPTPSYELFRANRIYVDEAVLLTKQYKADILDPILAQNSHKRVDFQNDPDEARAKINKYVENHTGGEIVDFLKEDHVTSLTRMFLVNALSLKAQWDEAFRPERTKQADFQVSSDESTSANFMISSTSQCDTIYGENGAYSGVVIPFKDSQLSMVMVMPTEPGDFNAIDSNVIQSALGKVTEDKWRGTSLCQLIIPKFRVETGIDELIPALKRMGITSIFEPRLADLSNMLQKDTEDIYVSDATHKATLEIDEKGVRASAATGIGASARMLPQTVVINKPFMFMVRHESTGSTLFMGKISKPNV